MKVERTVDRTSYRRSARLKEPMNEKVLEEIPKRKKYPLSYLFLDQIIVSLLIILELLVTRYFGMNDWEYWMAKNMSQGLTIHEVIQRIQEKNSTTPALLYSVLASGEENGEKVNPVTVENDEKSGEELKSGEYLSAVEGINQMAEDAFQIQSRYSFIVPVKGSISSHFGSRESTNTQISSYHTGTDIAANTGENIYASHDGKVILANEYFSYGNCVILEEENLVTLYAHCSSIEVKEGQFVKQGDVIAKVGMTGNATGPHLHFEIRYEGRFVDPEKVLWNSEKNL